MVAQNKLGVGLQHKPLQQLYAVGASVNNVAQHEKKVIMRKIRLFKQLSSLLKRIAVKIGGYIYHILLLKSISYKASIKA